MSFHLNNDDQSIKHLPSGQIALRECFMIWNLDKESKANLFGSYIIDKKGNESNKSKGPINKSQVLKARGYVLVVYFHLETTISA